MKTKSIIFIVVGLSFLFFGFFILNYQYLYEYVYAFKPKNAPTTGETTNATAKAIITPGNSENSGKVFGKNINNNDHTDTWHSYDIDSVGVQITIPSHWQEPTECIFPYEKLFEESACATINVEGGQLDIVKFQDTKKLGKMTEKFMPYLILMNKKIVSGPLKSDITNGKGQQYHSSSIVYTSMNKKTGVEIKEAIIELAKPDSTRTWLVFDFRANANQYEALIKDIEKALSTISPIFETDNNDDED